MSISKKRDNILLICGVLLATVLIVFLILHDVNENKKANIQSNTTSTQSTKNSVPLPGDIDTTLLYTLTNVDRANAGIAPLALDQALINSAQAKCSDMVSKNYYDHSDPNGVLWTSILKQYVPYYYAADENIDVNTDDRTSPDINTIFMNSSVHRTAILNNQYTDFGAAACSGTYQGVPAVYVVEHFAHPAPAPKAASTNPSPNNLPLCPMYDPNPYASHVPGIDCF